MYRIWDTGCSVDLIRALLPNSGGSTSSVGLEPEDPGDRHYRYCCAEALRL